MGYEESVHCLWGWMSEVFAVVILYVDSWDFLVFELVVLYLWELRLYWSSLKSCDLQTRYSQLIIRWRLNLRCFCCICFEDWRSLVKRYCSLQLCEVWLCWLKLWYVDVIPLIASYWILMVNIHIVSKVYGGKILVLYLLITVGSA